MTSIVRQFTLTPRTGDRGAASKDGEGSTIEAVNIERGARELALGPPGNLLEDQGANASPQGNDVDLALISCIRASYRGRRVHVGPAPVREEDTMGLYERLLAEAVQESGENPEREERRRRQARKRQRMQAYVNSRRRAVIEEGST
jgi:hypothetical protein